MLALFEGFADGIPASWTKVGNWLGITGGAFHMAEQNNLATIVVPFDGSPNQTISSAVTVLGLSNNNGGSLGIVDRFTAAGDAGIHCGSGKAATEFFGLINAASGIPIKSVAFPFDIGAFGIALHRQQDRYLCEAVELTATTKVEDVVNLGGVGTKIGLRARTASALYAWLMVVSSP